MLPYHKRIDVLLHNAEKAFATERILTIVFPRCNTAVKNLAYKKKFKMIVDYLKQKEKQGHLFSKKMQDGTIYWALRPAYLTYAGTDIMKLPLKEFLKAAHQQNVN